MKINVDSLGIVSATHSHGTVSIEVECHSTEMSHTLHVWPGHDARTGNNAGNLVVAVCTAISDLASYHEAGVSDACLTALTSELDTLIEWYEQGKGII
jgi:hypothetical protein